MLLPEPLVEPLVELEELLVDVSLLVAVDEPESPDEPDELEEPAVSAAAAVPRLSVR